MPRPVLISILLLFFAIAAIAYFGFFAAGDPPLGVRRDDAGLDENGESPPSTSAQRHPSRSGSVEVGGLRRPASDVADIAATAGAMEDGVRDPFNFGMTVPVPLDANPHVALVAEKFENRFEKPDEFAAATALLAQPQQFNANRYKTDSAYRQGYLMSVAPGRVFQPAQPEQGVLPLQSLSPSFQRMDQGEAVRLEVLGVPGFPYTFTALDMGQFSENSMTSITVEADESGVASVGFTSGSGAVGDSRVLVAGPASSGQVKFLVDVLLPK